MSLVVLPVKPAAADRVGADLSGRDQMVRSVLASWSGHLVFVAAGFFLPRFIDHHAGQATLGVWDFAWSLVSYFGLAQVGIGSSVNRYVAGHRAEGDIPALNCTVSSVVALQSLAALIVLGLTALAAAWAPTVLEPHIVNGLSADGQVVIICLGFGLAIQVAFDSFRGVITGCHRWDYHNAINAGFHGATVLAMFSALALGGGLRSLAVVHLGGTLLTEVIRAVVAFRVCPKLEIAITYVEWARARAMLTFGGKVGITAVASLLVYQTTSLIIATYLGVAALALYARPLALVTHVAVFVQKLAFVLTPTVSSMHATDDQKEVGALLIATTRYSAAIALPLLLLLGIMGGPILRLWMGALYEYPTVLAVLAAGHLLPIAHAPILSILAGLNRHGRPALLALASAVVTAGLVWLTVAALEWGFVGAAVAMCLPMAVLSSLVFPAYACRQLGLSVRRYYAAAWGRVWACALPFAFCLGSARLLLLDHPVRALLIGGLISSAVLFIMYWRWVIPIQIKATIRSGLRSRPERWARGLRERRPWRT
jgi:O-antigen/teichoic acid export membrane protein